MTTDHINRKIDRFLRRWDFVAARNIEHFAERSAEWLQLEAPPRLATAALCELGVTVRREGLPAGIDAVWSVENGAYVIRISPFVGGPRANFTLWHEWFEVMASRPAFPHRLGAGARERLADRYAAALTMPALAVACSLQEFAGSGDKTDVMAARFGISVAAMRRRIRELASARRGRTEARDASRETHAGLGSSFRGYPPTSVYWSK